MPVVKVLTTTFLCGTCGASITHVAGTSTLLAEEYRVAKRWIRYGDAEHREYACPRCQPIVSPLIQDLAIALDDAIIQARRRGWVPRPAPDATRA